MVTELVRRYELEAADVRPAPFNVNLNLDGNTATNNLSVRDLETGAGPSNADIGLSLGRSDLDPYMLYRINFDFGDPDDLSNQEAIVKQGKALGEVLSFLVHEIGHERVVLVGHSMGGLASRAYLQWGRTGSTTPGDFWVNRNGQGDHHVAKVVTIGTPHNGSQLAGFPTEIFRDPNGNAARDLVYHYGSFSGPPEAMDPDDSANSVFLYGGSESDICCSHYSQDVNCNGLTSTQVQGINDVENPYRDNPNMPLPEDIGYFWIIGDAFDNPAHGDGLVRADRQYLGSKGETRVILACHVTVGLCCGEVEAVSPIVEGLDEPDLFTRAWRLPTDELVSAFVTHQGDGGTAEDTDIFFFEPQGNGRASLSIESSFVPLTLTLYDDQGGLVSEVSGSAPLEIQLDYDDSVSSLYYVEVVGTGDSIDWTIPCEVNPADSTNLPYLLYLELDQTTVSLTTPTPTAQAGTPIQLEAALAWTDGSLPLADIPILFETDLPGSFGGCVAGFESCTAMTDAGGRASVTFTAATNGTSLIRASAVTGGMDTVVVNFGDGGITVTATPNPVEVELPSTLNIEVTDAAGNPVGAGHPVTLSTSHPGFFSGNGASSPTSPTTVLTDANGETWVWFAGEATGTANLTVTAPGAAGTVYSLVVDPAPGATQIDLNVAFKNGTSGYSDYEVETRILDSGGAPIPGETVTFSTSRGTLDPTSCNTGPTGVCDVDLRVTESGWVTLSASASGRTQVLTFYAQVGDPECADMVPVRTFSFGNDEIYGLDYSPDGATLVASSWDGPVRAWNTSDDSVKWSGEADDNRVTQVSISPDGTKVLVNHDDGQDIFDLATGNLICTGDIASGEEAVNGVFVSNTAHFHGSDGSSSTSPRVFRRSSLCGSASPVYTMPDGDDFQVEGRMDYTPTRNWVAVGSHDGNYFVFNASNGSLVRSGAVAAGNDDGFDVDFDTTGSRMLAVAWRVVKIFNTSNWTSTSYSPTTVGNWIYGGRFLDNDQKIALSGRGTLEILDVSSGQCVRKASLDGRGYEIAWNPSRQELAVGTSSGKIHIFRPLAPIDLEPPILSVSFPSDGHQTNESTLTTFGRVTDNVAVTELRIQGNPVALDSQGNFSHVVSLAPGTNTITYLARDAAGNETPLERQVEVLVDDTPPVISDCSALPSPAPIGTSVLIECSISDGDSGLDEADVTILRADGMVEATLTLNAVGGDRYRATFDSTAAPVGTYTLDVEAVDHQGNVEHQIGAGSFQLIECFSLNLEHSGMGSDPVPSPGQSVGCPAGSYVSGQVVQLAASPAVGWQVAGWMGTDFDAGTQTTNVLTMPAADHTVSVQYAASCFLLTTAFQGLGADLIRSPESSSGCPLGRYHFNEIVLVSGAEAAPGWHIQGWSGTQNDSSTAGSNTVSMPASDHYAEVIYGASCFQLTMEHSGEGDDPSVSLSSSEGCQTGSYNAGEQLQLTASPAPGWVVGGWTGTENNASTLPTNQLVMPPNDHMVGVQYVETIFADGFESGDLSNW